MFFNKNTRADKAAPELPNCKHKIKSQQRPAIKGFHLGPLTHTARSYRLLFFPFLAFFSRSLETKGNYSGMSIGLEKMNSTWHWLKRNGCFFPEVCSGVNHWRAEDCGELSKEISTIASCPLHKKEHSQTVLTQILITLKFLCKDVWKTGLQHCLKSIKNENKHHIKSNYSLSIVILTNG